MARNPLTQSTQSTNKIVRLHANKTTQFSHSSAPTHPLASLLQQRVIAKPIEGFKKRRRRR